MTSGTPLNDRLEAVAERVEISPSRLKDYRYAASYCGYDHPHVDQALLTLTNRLSAARLKQSPHVEAFERQGISILQSNEAVIEQSIRSFGNADDAPLALANSTMLFGDEGRKMYVTARAYVTLAEARKRDDAVH